MRAKQLSQLAEVSKDTLRYYESIGLISAPNRDSNGYRHYNEQHLRELKFIKYAKSVGFELKKIKEAIPHLQSPKPDCPLLLDAVNEQLTAIDNKIAELQLARQTLHKWIHPNA